MAIIGQTAGRNNYDELVGVWGSGGALELDLGPSHSRESDTSGSARAGV